MSACSHAPAPATIPGDSRDAGATWDFGGFDCKLLVSKSKMETLMAVEPNGDKMIQRRVILMADDQTFADGVIDEYDDLRVGHPYCAVWRPKSSP